MAPPEALQPFLLLAKSARGRAAAAVVSDATAAPGVFAFGELLDMPNVKEARQPLRRSRCVFLTPSLPQLEGTEHASALQLLRLFAYGTLADYHGASRRPPRPTPAPALTPSPHSRGRLAAGAVAGAAAEAEAVDGGDTRGGR